MCSFNICDPVAFRCFGGDKLVRLVTSTTMNDLRLHKGVVSRHEKFKEARRVAQTTRQRAARSGLLQNLRNFLTSDSFMYGPLLESPPPTVLRRDDSEPHTPGTCSAASTCIHISSNCS